MRAESQALNAHDQGDDRRTNPSRRTQRRLVHFPERRTGFDRRSCEHSSLRCAYDRALRSYRTDTARFFVVLATIVILNFVDLLLTVRALGMGAAEINPIMSGLLSSSMVGAALVKVGIVGVVAIMLLSMRRFRRVIELSLLLLGIFTALTTYHAVVAIRLVV